MSSEANAVAVNERAENSDHLQTQVMKKVIAYLSYSINDKFAFSSSFKSLLFSLTYVKFHNF